jgi:hypothetical protein
MRVRGATTHNSKADRSDRPPNPATPRKRTSFSASGMSQNVQPLIYLPGTTSPFASAPAQTKTSEPSRPATTAYGDGVGLIQTATPGGAGLFEEEMDGVIVRVDVGEGGVGELEGVGMTGVTMPPLHAAAPAGSETRSS